MNSPKIPSVKTRAPASDHLIHHFLDNGWLGQARPKGVLFTFAVSAAGLITSSHRSGTSFFSTNISALVASRFRPGSEWSTYLGLREHKSNRIWLLDCLVAQGIPLNQQGLQERLKHVPRDFISPTLKAATPLASSQAIRKALDAGQDVLFRHPTMAGWRSEGMVLLTVPRGD